jgi:lipopolysaccharide export system protein LptC
MNDRRIWWIALLLAAIAGTTQWLIWLRRESPVEPFIGPPRSDYDITNFSMSALDAKGALSFTVRAPRAARNPGQGTFDIDSPRFVLRDAEGVDWNVRAERGWVRADGRELRLVGDVNMERRTPKPADAIALRSERIHAQLDPNIITSPLAVTIERPGSILTGIGLHADIDHKRLMLKDQVNGRFEPRLRGTR